MIKSWTKWVRHILWFGLDQFGFGWVGLVCFALFFCPPLTEMSVSLILRHQVLSGLCLLIFPVLVLSCSCSFDNCVALLLVLCTYCKSCLGQLFIWFVEILWDHITVLGVYIHIYFVHYSFWFDTKIKTISLEY